MLGVLCRQAVARVARASAAGETPNHGETNSQDLRLTGRASFLALAFLFETPPPEGALIHERRNRFQVETAGFNPPDGCLQLFSAARLAYLLAHSCIPAVR